MDFQQGIAGEIGPEQDHRDLEPEAKNTRPQPRANGLAGEHAGERTYHRDRARHNDRGGEKREPAKQR